MPTYANAHVTALKRISRTVILEFGNDIEPGIEPMYTTETLTLCSWKAQSNPELRPRFWIKHENPTHFYRFKTLLGVFRLWKKHFGFSVDFNPAELIQLKNQF